MPAPLLRLVLPLALALWTGCVPSTGQVERGLARELPRVIGPADHYEVAIDDLRARSGEARRVSVTGRRVRPEGAPVLDRFGMALHGVKYDRGAKRLERVDSARAVAHITPDDLAAYLEGNAAVREAAVALEAPDRATLRVRPSLAGIALPPGASVEVQGRLVAENGRVHFAVSDLRAGGLSLGGRAAGALAQVVNPLVDLTGQAVALRVTDVRVEGGAVRVEVTGNPSGLRLR